MKIVIQAEDWEGKDVSFNFTDEDLDNYNFVDVTFGEGDDIKEFTLDVDGLMSVAEAFENKRMRTLERESLMVDCCCDVHSSCSLHI